MSAWSSYYYKQDPLRYGHDDPYGYACVAIKNELLNNGFTDYGIIASSQVIGLQASSAIRGFQAKNDLQADGVVGPRTARLLFQKRTREAQTKYAIPNDLLCKIKTLESGNDPGAVGSSDPHDHGLLQINLIYHPEFTLESATDPQTALEFGAKTLNSAHAYIEDWDGAVASWNVGTYYAKKWVQAGKPAFGMIVGGIDWYARASKYVSLVKTQFC